MGLISRIAGIIGSVFQIGGPSGPTFTASGSRLTASGEVAGSDPTANTDFVTLEFLSSHGISFSPVTLMEQAVTNGFDTFSTVSGSLTGAVSFFIYDTLNTHTCTGVRFYWKGAATTIKASLWKYTGSAAGVRVTSVNIVVTAVAGEYTVSFTSAQTLLPGVVYAVSVWDTSGTSVTNVGNPTNNASPLGEMLNTETMLASYFHGYCMPAGNGGGTLRPWSLYANGDILPLNITSTGFTPVEPVLT
jgi:hypothetical protein